MSDWYDREGRPISMQEWAALRSNNLEYFRVALTEVGPYTVSTVHLGLDHRHWGEGAPLIFETMVFASGEWKEQEREERFLSEIDAQRYSTEDEAVTGHRQMVELIMATTQMELGETDGRVSSSGEAGGEPAGEERGGDDGVP